MTGFVECVETLQTLLIDGVTERVVSVVDRSVHVYELTHMTRNRHRRMKEIQSPGTVHSIAMLNERLVVGFSSSFALYSVQGDVAPTGTPRRHATV